MKGTLQARERHWQTLYLLREHIESILHKSFQNADEKEHPLVSQEVHTTQLDSQTEDLQNKKLQTNFARQHKYKAFLKHLAL